MTATDSLVLMIAKRDLEEWKGRWPIPRDCRLSLTATDDERGVRLTLESFRGAGRDAEYQISNYVVRLEGLERLLEMRSRGAIVDFVAPLVERAIEHLVTDMFPFHEGEGLP